MPLGSMSPPVLVDAEGKRVPYKVGEYLILQTRMVIVSTTNPSGGRNELDYWHYEHVVERES